ncbi:MAG: TRAP transporter permease, partial [Billgrantia desiderata]
GGPAKVSIFSSGLMGSMSGSVISNVLTTGVLSIPAMRRIGMGRSFSGGVEACASTGGVLMPPVMGATAFVMAMFLDVPYAAVALAAVIPSILYFLGLFIQIDAYAARHDIKGLPAAELPSLVQTLKQGWYFIFVFALLVWMLLVMQREAVAPFYATALLLLLNQCSRRNRWGWRELGESLSSAAKLFAELVAILAGVGMLVGALSMTGLSGTIANDFIHIAGGSMPLLLIMGALTSFVLGIGMTVTAAYIFLAVALAPALIQGGGLDPMAVHMFILYWGMLSFITPPVALGAFAAATVAGARPMATGLQAMRLGSVIYFIPFLFVLNPALIMQGEPLQIGL